MINFINSKKAMGVGQVFVFIIAALTFSLIIIFGYRTISQFLESGEQVEFVQFKNDMENSIKKVYTEYGAIRIDNYHLPAKYSQICFVDLDYPIDDNEVQKLCDQDEIACGVWEEFLSQSEKEKTGYGFADENVFLTPSADVKLKVYKISIAPDPDTQETRGFLCRKISQGSFSLMLEGKGDHTELSEPLQGNTES